MDYEPSNVNLKLSAQRALWGHIPPILRSVSLEYKNHKIFFQCVYDGEPSEDDKELLSMAGTEIAADFPDHIEEFVEQHLAVKFPEKVPDLENLVYLRHEHNYYR